VGVDQALASRFLKFWQEKVPGCGRGFFCAFWGVFEGGFGKQGVFWMVFGGEFVVDSWWIVVVWRRLCGGLKICQDFEIISRNFSFRGVLLCIRNILFSIWWFMLSRRIIISTIVKKKTVSNCDQVTEMLQVLDSDIDAVNVTVPLSP
jgi:hypothetical protein